MRKLLVSTTALVAFAVAFSFAFGADTSKRTGVKPGDEAPNLTLQDQNGNPVSLDQFKDKIVVLEWFNDACPFVQRHYKAGTMNDLASKWKDKDVVWLAINTTPGTSVAHNKKVVEKWQINHPVLDDSQGTVGKEYGAKSTPHMFIIDKDGKIAYVGGIDNDPSGDKGSARVNYVEKALEDLTSGQPVAIPQTRQYGCGVHYAH